MGFKTVAEGVLVRDDSSRLYRGKPDRYFTIRYRVNGVRHQEKLGWASEGMNLERAKRLLAELKTAAATGIGALTLKQRREDNAEARRAKEEAPTLAKVWDAYKQTLKGRERGNCEGYVRNHLQDLMTIKIENLRTQHVDNLKQILEEKGLAPGTVRGAIGLVRRIVFWGAKHGYNEQPLLHKLYFNMPKVDNKVTENLTNDELKIFLEALESYPDKIVAASMKFALLTGVRRHALFKLVWRDIDFASKQICLRGVYAKNGKTSYIPLTPPVEKLLLSIRGECVADDLVFQQNNFQNRAVKKLVEYMKPFMPVGFRPYHGLRHTFASKMALSGASLLEIKELLTHGDMAMTVRYAHLCSDSLRERASVMGTILQAASNEGNSSHLFSVEQGDIESKPIVRRKLKVG